jgi:hypothetical protein
MTDTAYESTISDWPRSQMLEKEGGIRLTGKYDSIHGSWLHVMLVLAVTALVIFITVQATHGDFGRKAVHVLLVFPITLPAAFFATHRLFRSNLDVKVFPDSIVINGKTYEMQPHLEFRLSQHSKAAQEEAAEIRSNQRKPRTYRNAVEVVMQYGERRVVIVELDMKDMERAHALVLRLQGITENLAQAVAEFKAGRAAPAAASEFGRAPDLR